MSGSTHKGWRLRLTTHQRKVRTLPTDPLPPASTGPRDRSTEAPHSIAPRLWDRHDRNSHRQNLQPGLPRWTLVPALRAVG
jgi:hypothetical protein